MILATSALLIPMLTAGLLQAVPDQPEYLRQILFKLDESMDVADLQRMLLSHGIEGEARRAFTPVPEHMVDRVGIGRIHVLDVSPSDREVFLNRVRGLDGVSWAEANRGGHALTGGTLVPNDPSFSTQWCLDQPNDIDMDLPEAWSLQGGFDVAPLVVAVIDTGIKGGGSFPDLAGIAWAHPGEIAGNGLDDDGNGFVDDVGGYDFVRDDGIPEDEYGHGTAVTSIMSAHTDNGADLAGVAPGVDVMVLKAFNELGDFPVSGPYAGFLSAAAGLIYAADNGAVLVNSSWGFCAGFPQVIGDAVTYALDNQVHLVFAAGNDEGTTFLPAEMDGVIAVAAIGSDGVKSNWGAGSGSNSGPWVDVSAGGTAVPAYGFSPGVFAFDGTSVAAPNAAGVALMALGRAPDLSQEDLRSLLMQAAVSVDGLNPAYAGQLGAGHVNAHDTLLLLQPTADLGHGLSGDSTPHLNVWGQTHAGGLVTLSISSAAPTASGGLVVGFSQATVSFKGGVLVPSPDLIVPVGTDENGAWRIDAPLSAEIPTGVPIFLQALITDDGAPSGFAFTTGKSFTGL